MSGYENFDRRLSAWFEADALPATPPGKLERALEVTRGRRPRPAWLAGFGSHWVGEVPVVGSHAASRRLISLRFALVALIALVAFAGGAILFGGRLIQSLPAVVPSPTLPSSLTLSPPLPSSTPLPPLDGLGHLAYGLDGSIYVADWDGGNPLRIANGAFDPGGAGPAGCGSFGMEGPMWSPDGRYLAYRSAWDASCLGTPGAGNVYVSDPEGHAVTSFPGSGWRVAWSPDSNRVATWVGDLGWVGGLGRTIGIYGLNGVRQTLLTAPEGCRLPGDFDPVWSPDGMSLVVWPCDIPLDGGTPSPFPTSDPRSKAQWAYSPNGALVAYSEANGRLDLATADGSDDRGPPLTHPPQRGLQRAIGSPS